MEANLCESLMNWARLDPSRSAFPVKDLKSSSEPSEP